MVLMTIRPLYALDKDMISYPKIVGNQYNPLPFHWVSLLCPAGAQQLHPLLLQHGVHIQDITGVAIESYHQDGIPGDSGV